MNGKEPSRRHGARQGRGRATLRVASRWLARLALLALLLPLLTAGTYAAEPGLIASSDVVLTARDLARLRAQPPPPTITARSAYVWDVTNNAELYSKAADARAAPASTTKILTALLVIEQTNPADTVTIVPSDMGEPDESTMGTAPGDVLRVEDLLYGMLLVSGGDAARALARHVGTTLLAGQPGDPLARFMQAMNDRVAAMGLPNTHFVNPDGYDAPGQYTSARDLARLANAALANPLFAKIVATKETTRTTVDGAKTFKLVNTDELLGVRPGVHGVKTGTTDLAGECLVSAQWTPNGRVLSVVLGSGPGERYRDTVALLDYANRAFRWVPLGQGADLPGLAAALDRWGVTLRERRLVVVPAWEASGIRYLLFLDTSAAPDGARGRVVFVSGSRQLLTLPVYPK